ncbi:TPA: hypothetical protein M4Z33_000334 [Klebsiella pneumoniae]|nr:hypothetical protein [Klebsiella pneumoniae]HDK5952495.1 hypothetical protein [Klebsiella pneumoniae]
MTNITELAQQELAQLRAELSNQAIGSKDHLRKIALSLVDKLEKCRDREIRWLALSDEKSKIINDQKEALEKAQQQTTESENRVRKQNRHICELFDDNTALRQRIAELEARTVKLPEPFELAGLSGGSSYYYADEIDAALTAQGIKVEAE